MATPTGLVRCQNNTWGMPVTEGLSSAEGVRRRRMAGFEARQSPDAPGLWFEFADYPEGRVGLVIGSCADAGETQRLRPPTTSRLHDGADPAAVLRGLGPTTASLLAAVIDPGASLMTYSSVGVAAPAVAAPELPQRALAPTDGRLESVDLSPGGTALLSTHGAISPAPWPASNERILDDLFADSGARGDGIVAVLYRHPPSPLNLAVPAEPASLAVVRRQLRTWLAQTGADDEMCADILLAVGEAATNAAEHAHVATGQPVQIAVQANLTDGIMRFTVSDNGSWKTQKAPTGYRGHGIRLMKALVDGVDVSTTSEGTTVQMLKELAG